MDDRILFLINREWTHPVLDWLMAISSSYDFWMPFVYLAVALILWRGGFRARMCVLSLGLVLLVLNQAAGLAKKQFDRPRPGQHMPNVRQIDLDPQTSPRVMALGKPLMEKIGEEPATVAAGKGRSFPSGHTTNLFGTATVLAVFYRRRGWLAYGCRQWRTGRIDSSLLARCSVRRVRNALGGFNPRCSFYLRFSLWVG